MAETCIVCLGDLCSADTNQTSTIVSVNTNSASKRPLQTLASQTACSSATAYALDQSALIAHLLPCGHELHNECLKPWVERANSCPICRQNFNKVELKSNVYGPSLDSYEVEHKRQVADIDPTMIVDTDDDLFDEALMDYCIICECPENNDDILGCDGCDGTFHLHCAGLENVPAGSWFCTFCQDDGMSNRHHSRPSTVLGRRTIRRVNAARRPRSPDAWARVWQSVWDNLNLDLDFPFDEEEHEIVSARSHAQRRDFKEWERRFRVAERQGGAARFRESAAALLDGRQLRSRGHSQNPESQEELRAWNAFEKARELNASTAVGNTRRNKRKSPSSSPSEPPLMLERMLKRPRTRKALDETDRAYTESSTKQCVKQQHSCSQQIAKHECQDLDGRSFFSALLDEVRTSPNATQASGASDQVVSASSGQADPLSPPISSIPGSPLLSALSSPRSRSVSPVRYQQNRPASPPLTSIIAPSFQTLQKLTVVLSTDQASQRLDHQILQAESPATPPFARDKTRSRKAEIESMVSAALQPAYKNRDIDKDQYTDINRTISRRLYERVGSDGLSTDDKHQLWQSVVAEEVEVAVRKVKRPPEVDTLA